MNNGHPSKIRPIALFFRGKEAQGFEHIVPRRIGNYAGKIVQTSKGGKQYTLTVDLTFP